jgi:glycosyltransferase involved in cell wall biosynthesis
MNQENLPLVTVICTSYNHEKFIKKCLDGFVMQKTNFTFEIILHDDASTDNTLKIVKEYESKYPHLFNNIYQTENHFSKKGVSIWTDIMFPKAQGKYIALCEGDDYWIDPYKLQKQVDFLEACPDFSMCFHEVSCLDQKYNKDLGFYTNSSKDKYVTEDLFDKHFIATCSIVFRNNIIFPNWFNNVSSGDKLLIFLNSLNGYIKFIDNVMGVYRIHSGGISKTHIGIKKVYDMSTFLNLINPHTNFKYDELCKKSLLHEIEVHIVPNYIKEKKLTAFKTLEIIKELTKRTIKKFNLKKA